MDSQKSCTVPTSRLPCIRCPFAPTSAKSLTFVVCPGCSCDTGTVWCHALTHDATRSLSRGRREVVAESIAYAVCSLAGLEMELRSVDFVAGWPDDPDAFKVGMATMHIGASSLITAIQPALSEVASLSLTT